MFAGVQMKSKTVTLFLIDGTSTGRIKCQLHNWTGVAYRIPRTELEACSKTDPGRDIAKHLKQSGVYFLMGYNDATGRETVYVGQASTRKNGEGILCRLLEHNRSNGEKEKYADYWNEAIVFTTTNDTFGPTEISYLENRFSNMAKEAKRFEVSNGNEPSIGHVTEETESDLEEFIEYAKIVMGVLGNRVFVPFAEPTVNNTEPVINEKTIFTGNVKNCEAKGTLTDEGFVVLKGSAIGDLAPCARGKKIESDREKYSSNISNGLTTADILFGSPSAAASFVSGCPKNGYDFWKAKGRKSLGDYLNKN